MTSDMDDRAPGAPGLGRRAVGGVIWQALSFSLGKAFMLVSTIILARLLVPEDFGIVALALVFITYAQVLTDLGVAQALVYLPEDDRQNDAALTLALIWSSILVLVAMVAAPAVAEFYGRPDVVPIFRVLALSLVLGATAEVPDALLRKRLRFRQRLIANLLQSFGKGGVSITMAVAGFGAWAIVGGHVAGFAIWSLASWVLVGKRPGLRFWRLSRTHVRPLLAFGIPVTGNALLLALVFNTDYLIVGRVLGTEALGYYTVAFRIPELVVTQALWVVAAVSFPLYSLVRQDPERLRRGYVTSVRLQSVWGAAVGTALAVTAPMLVPVVFGAKWLPSVAPLQAMGLYAVFRSLGSGTTELCNGIGRPGLAAWLSVSHLVLLVPVLLFATRYGIEGVAWGHLVVAVLIVVIFQTVASRLIGMSPWRLATAMRPVLTVGIGMAVGAGAVRLWLPGSNLVRLLAALAAGGVGVLAALGIAERGFLRELRGLMQRLPRRQDAAAPDPPPVLEPPPGTDG